MSRRKSPAPPKPNRSIPCTMTDDPDETHRNYAKVITSPECATLRVLTACEQKTMVDQLDVPAMIRLLREQADAIVGGDMKQAEAMLAAQATALQSLFVRLIERAMGQEYLSNMEAFARLALKAQAQCRTTLETLATIKNPPVVYAKQINQTTGPQQVVNGVAAPSRAREIEKGQNELLEAHHGNRMDTRATSKAIGTDQDVATVACQHRAKD